MRRILLLAPVTVFGEEGFAGGHIKNRCRQRQRIGIEPRAARDQHLRALAGPGQRIHVRRGHRPAFDDGEKS